ncbi:MAG: anti-sigma factor antagonist [Nitrospirae bacterium]|nr:MAG: anti-sigma factor antagonist [Nitrospirota bacterium]
MLKFSFEMFNNTGVIRFEGEITYHSATVLKEALYMSLDNSDHVLLDFSKVSMIDSFFFEQMRKFKEVAQNLKKRMTVMNLPPYLNDSPPVKTDDSFIKNVCRLVEKSPQPAEV